MGGPCADKDQEKRGIINVFGQFCPGKPHRGQHPPEYKGIRANDGVLDDEKQRLKWFQATLTQIAELPELESVAFPYQIGCGLAGGDWKQYRAALEEFAERVKERNVKVGGFLVLILGHTLWCHQLHAWLENGLLISDFPS